MMPLPLWGIRASTLFPWQASSLTESIFGYRVTAQSNPTCYTTDGCEMPINFLLERPGVVKFVVIVVVTVNCAYPFRLGIAGEITGTHSLNTGLIAISIFLFMCESVGSFASSLFHVISSNQCIRFRCPRSAHSQGRRYHFNLHHCLVLDVSLT
jgi:hypothetical protein